MSVIDINKIVLWNSFKSKLIEKIENTTPFEVDLAFDYKDTAGRIHSFSSNDDIFITDVIFDKDANLIFNIPSGSSYKPFGWGYADSIAHKELGSLLDVMKDCYESARKEIDGRDYAETLSEYLEDIKESRKDRSKLIDILNNSSEHIKKQIEAEKDRKSFSNIGEFGIF